MSDLFEQAIDHLYLTALPGAIKRAVHYRLEGFARYPYEGWGSDFERLPREVLALPIEEELMEEVDG